MTLNNYWRSAIVVSALGTDMRAYHYDVSISTVQFNILDNTLNVRCAPVQSCSLLIAETNDHLPEFNITLSDPPFTYNS